MPTSYDIVKDAILNKKIIKASYDGYPRKMCPHVIGLNKKGERQALCYQFGGMTSKGHLQPDGSPGNWRCVRIDGLTNVTSETGNWHTTPKHTRPQTCVVEIHAEVDY